MAFLKILFYLIVLIAVLVLAYYTTRMPGQGTDPGYRGNGDSGPDGTGP